LLQLIYFRTWMSTVPSTLSGLNASLLVRDPKTRRFRVNYDPKIREMLHEAEQLMKLDLNIGSLALNLCMDEDRLKTTNDKSVRSSKHSLHIAIASINEIHYKTHLNAHFCDNVNISAFLAFEPIRVGACGCISM